MNGRTWSLISLALILCVLGVRLWTNPAASPGRPRREKWATSGAAPPGPAPAPTARQPERRSPEQPPRDRTAAALDEARLMARLRSTAQSDPARAIALAREGNSRWPHSADAPERTSILIHALAATGQSMQARGEAERMVNDSPDSPWVREIERFTGAHRHRNVRVNDAGQIEYYDAPTIREP